ncbi:MurR/RpiR family transcriptional regulator [Lacticaseibacillus saniviri]|nr:MurR/RpiR family transcriptional regulator [Lacticaseibacillus saniviri]MCG4282228.1 MurR/RpiR family transcriptional regulator [Lacticaseibacillus saniviri]
MTSFRMRLQAYQANLSDTEQRLADYLSAHQSEASHLTISALSKATHISTATISRFAKNLGFQNFQALKMALAQPDSQASTLFVEISPHDSLTKMASKIFHSNIDALEATNAALTEDQLEQATDLITNAEHVGLYGLGASNIVALDGYHKFLRTPIDVLYAQDYHMQLMTLTRLGPNDVAIIVSHSGENHDAIALAQLACDRGVPVIVITSSANATLTKLADVTLLSIAEESQYRTEALHALIAQMSLMDALFMLTAIKTDSQTAAVFRDIRQEIQKTRE